MKKFILMSVLIATFVIPLMTLKLQLDPKTGSKVIQKRTLIFCISYVIIVLYVAPRLFH